MSVTHAAEHDTVGARTELAQRTTIKAYRIGPYVLILAEGELPTPGHEVDIEPDPRKIHPQQFDLLRHRRPGIWPTVVVSYRYGELVRFPEGERTVTVHHADGHDDVVITEPDQGIAGLADVTSALSGMLQDDEVIGVSSKLSFDEAFADALANLPEYPPSYPDRLTTVKVVETGGLFGGFAGFHHLYVRVRAEH